MKRQTYFPLLAMILLAVGSVYAQMSSPIKVKIPFDFTAASATLPAGEYRVMTASVSGTLAIIGRDSASGFAGSHAAQANAPSSATKLVFHRYGDRYFLYQVWVENEKCGRELPATKLEQELRASNLQPKSVTILASR